MNEMRFKEGDRVRYRYASRQVGTITGAVSGGVGQWAVRWDDDPYGPREQGAWEDNLELLEVSALVTSALDGPRGVSALYGEEK